jgi:hypothetical protein
LTVELIDTCQHAFDSGVKRPRREAYHVQVFQIVSSLEVFRNIIICTLIIRTGFLFPFVSSIHVSWSVHLILVF